MTPLARRVFWPVCACLIGLVSLGCGGKPAPRHPQGATDPNAPVSDDAFPAALVDYLLAEPGSNERARRAPAVVGRQVARAADRFRARAPERAVASFLGAQLLLRLGELSPKVLGPRAPDALRAMAREYARRGVEGPAGALYSLLADAGTNADKADAKTHLAALENWKALQQKSRGPVSRAALQAEIATYMVLFRLDEASRVEAEKKLVSWVAEAVKLRDAYRGDARMPARDEGSEAVRAFSVAPLMLAGLYLRDADPQGALRALSRDHMRAIVRPELLGLLDEVADSPSAENWFRLGTILRNGSREGDDGGAVEELAVLRYAAFVAAVEAYRLIPTDMNVAVLLALNLRDYGMDEAIPFVVYPSVKALPNARNLTAALSLGFESMAAHSDSDENANARRIYQGMAPILAVAENAASKPQPSVARLRALMGNIELRDGNAEAARALLARSAASEPSALTDLVLAKLDKQAGRAKEALERAHAAAAREDAQRDPLLRCELLLLEGDLLRAAGEASKASEAYLAAARILFGLPEVEGLQGVRRQRLIADVYDRFGRTELAGKALAKATDAAAKDKATLSAMVGHRVARALAQRDVQAARVALDQGLAFEADGADMVYSATWLRLLERQGKLPPEPGLERLFSPWFDSSRWVGKIAEFSAGKRSADALVKAAKTGAERCEAYYYAGIDRELRGDGAGAQNAYQQALATGAVTLVEYELASERVRPQAALAPPEELERIDGTAKAREAALEAAKAAQSKQTGKPSKKKPPKR